MTSRVGTFLPVTSVDHSALNNAARARGFLLNRDGTRLRLKPNDSALWSPWRTAEATGKWLECRPIVDPAYRPKQRKGRGSETKLPNRRRLHDEPIYRTWTNMHNRCYSTTNKQYKDYGGRGIRVDEIWHDSVNFIRWSDSNPKPSPAHTLDRLDNDRGYGPTNCAWRTRTQQNRNSRHFNTLTSIADASLRAAARGRNMSVRMKDKLYNLYTPDGHPLIEGASAEQVRDLMRALRFKDSHDIGYFKSPTEILDEITAEVKS